MQAPHSRHRTPAHVRPAPSPQTVSFPACFCLNNCRRRHPTSASTSAGGAPYCPPPISTAPPALIYPLPLVLSCRRPALPQARRAHQGGAPGRGGRRRPRAGRHPSGELGWARGRGRREQGVCFRRGLSGGNLQRDPCPLQQGGLNARHAWQLLLAQPGFAAMSTSSPPRLLCNKCSWMRALVLRRPPSALPQ